MNLHRINTNPEDFGFIQSEIESNYFQLFNYIIGSELEPNPNFYSKEDVIHLNDIREIVMIMKSLVLLVSISILIIGFSIKKSQYLKILHYSSLLNLFICIIVLPFCLSNFNSLFIRFHQLIFTNEYWILDSSSSNLIKFFPEWVFLELTLLAVVFVIITSILGVMPWIIKKRKF